MVNLIKKFIPKNILFLASLLFLLTSILTSAQDSTRSEVYKDNFPRKYPLIKAKYPSYSLIAGYVLVSDANRNDPFAQHELGIRYLLGKGFPADTVKAIYWIRKAVDQNLPSARFNYGILLYNGIGVPWNPFEAFQNFKAAASAGLPEAQFATGLVFTDNLTVGRNFSEAYKYFKSAADAKNKDAIHAISQLLKSGFVPTLGDSSLNNKKNNLFVDEASPLINPNWEVDFFDFDSTKDGKTEDSKEFVNSVLSKNKNDLKRFLGLEELADSSSIKDTSTFGLIEFAAENESPEALMLVARCKESGIHYTKNEIAAAVNYLRAYRLGSSKSGEILFKLSQNASFVSLVQKAAKSNNPDAQYVYAALNAIGFNNQIPSEQAVELLISSSKKNHIPSIIELGLLHSLGTIVKKDRIKALSYWDKAKNLGSNEASIRIAFSNLSDSLTTNLEDDINTLTSLSNEGSVLAQTALGYCYENGIGVRENKAEAVKLYRHATQRGNQTAYNSLKRLYDEIRPDTETFQIYD